MSDDFGSPPFTLAEGRAIRLRDPFEFMAVKDGALQLWAPGGAHLSVPNCDWHLTGVHGKVEP